MNEENYRMFEDYMLTCMADSAHDKEHIYRVLYAAMDIASYEQDVDYDVLICACLLHDIGRQEQFENPDLCHAEVGSEKAYQFLRSNGFDTEYAEKVKESIRAHSYREDQGPESIEAKILFDADKLDVTGAMGIARTLIYNGQVNEPLYCLTDDGQVSDGTGDISPSFFQEYKYKLEGLYTKLHTRRATEIAEGRKAAAKAFYESLLAETQSAYDIGKALYLEKSGRS